MIILAATPIGNTGDASGRLAQALTEADVIAAEDTRRVRDLMGRMGVSTRARILPYHEHNEEQRTPELIDLAREGSRIVMVSDAGMPGISDPGYRLVNAAAAAGVAVTVVPGPSAVLTAVALSGLPSDRFCFEGFLPRKAGDRASALGALAGEERTMVFYEAPHRLEAALEAMSEAFGADRAAAMCRELTKTHEEVTRGTLEDLLTRARQGVRGEIVLVVAGRRAGDVGEEDLLAEVDARIAAGERMAQAVAQVAAAAGVRRRALYEAVLVHRRPPGRAVE